MATADGFKETVTLPDRAAGPSYREELVLPEGVSARMGEAGVELVDGSGAVVGTYGGGVAFDATYPGAGASASTPVEVRLLATAPRQGQGGSVATVEVSVDGAWLGRARFPVTIDPTYFRQTSDTGASDTFVSSGGNANTSWWNDPSLLVGSHDGSQLQRSYVKFNLSGIPSGPDVWVSDATLWLGNWYSPSCTPRTIDLYRLLGPFGSATTWNNRPDPEATTVASSGAVARGASGCPTDWVSLAATPIAQDWLRHGAANHGIELRAAAETDPANYRAFYSAQAAG
ncbi:MAG TPA: DNRLRE domain-containing protein, partial [Acidimicrobiales bacterium]|nr:DNRLRE domain-containing protein [Acidimicrobiales bacterium]